MSGCVLACPRLVPAPDDARVPRLLGPAHPCTPGLPEARAALRPKLLRAQFNTQLGHGAFKEVFKGYDEEEGNEIAWCQVVMDRIGESEKRAIAQEVELLKNVQHKHILAFIDCFELESPSKPIVFITEYMSSGTLKQCARAA